MSSRRNKQRIKTSTHALYQPEHERSSGPEKWLFETLGIGSAQSWCYGAVATLTAATLFLNGDGLTFEGDSIPVALAWQFLAAILLFVRWYQKRPLFENDANDLSVSKEKTEVFCVADLFAFLFFGWVVLSFLVTCSLGTGAPRNMLTMISHWGSFAAMYVTWRLLLNNKTIIRGMLFLFVAMIVAESSIAYYEYCYQGPKSRQYYFEHREELLKANNALTPGAQELFENRVKSVEPLGTYSLTNSLAGVLVPWFMLLLGVLLFGKYEISLAKIIVLLCFIIMVGLVLLMTKSRSALIAAMLGTLFLSYHFFALKVGNRRIVYGTLIGFVVLLLSGIGVAIAVGVLDREMITEASLSLSYRVQYWESSSKMIADHPLFGCGVGNFKENYTLYKLPTASETISDPHNLFFEVASNAGLPAVLFFVTLLATIFYFACFKSASVIGKQVNCITHPQSQCAPVEPVSHNEDAGKKMNPSWRLYIPFLLGGLLGIIFAFVQSLTNSVILSPEMVGIGLLGFLFGSVMLFPIFWNLTLSLRFIAPVCLLALIVNLLAAGGIAFPHVNVAFWFLLVLCANTFDCARKFDSRVCFLGTACLFFFGALLLYQFAFSPNFNANKMYREYADGSTRPTSISGDISLLEHVVRDDPYKTRVWLDLCQLYLLERREFPEEMQKKSGKVTWQLPVAQLPFVKDRSRFEKEMSLERVIANSLEQGIKSSPLSATVYTDFASMFLRDYEQANPIALMQRKHSESLECAILLFELAALRYPNNAVAYANLAYCYDLIGDKNASKTNAEKALQFDDVMWHSDQKLIPELRRQIEKLL